MLAGQRHLIPPALPRLPPGSGPRTFSQSRSVSRTRRVARRRVAGRRAGEPDRWRPLRPFPRSSGGRLHTVVPVQGGQHHRCGGWLHRVDQVGEFLIVPLLRVSSRGSPPGVVSRRPSGSANRSPVGGCTLVVSIRASRRARRRRGAVLDLCRGLERISASFGRPLPHRDRVHRPGPPWRAGRVLGGAGRRDPARSAAVALTSVSWLDHWPPFEQIAQASTTAQRTSGRSATVMVSGQGS